MNLTATLFLAASAALVMLPASAQIGSLTPVLIGSTGNFSTAGNVMLSASTGEPMVPTVSGPGILLTQGFQQPSDNGTLALNATVVYTNVSCAGAGDGTAAVTATGGAGPYTYTWIDSQNDTLGSVLATSDSLIPGSYTVTVTDAGNLSVTQSFTVIEGNGICGIHVYSGITANGDGHNDTWVIDYLELFQPNTVSIYNRWGVEVWNAVNYDNQLVVWNGSDQSMNRLPDGTYYYVITVGTESMKGWVELSH